jgi:His-Xaa-Ser repeat protein HxsA
MKWRDQLALLLGTASPFGLAVNAGLAAEAAPTDESVRGDPPEIQKDLLVFRDPAERDRLLLFAGHRSHSSHSSHRSHSSHYSGSSGHSSHSSHYSSSGGYVTPAPVYTPPPAPRPRPIVRPPAPKPHPAPLKAWEDPGVPDLTEEEASAATNTVASRQRLTTGEVASMVTKVQVALVIRGYDPGPVDGKFGAKTKVALGRFQAANNLPISAAMDLETLRLLGVDIGMPSRTEVKPAPAPPTAAGKNADDHQSRLGPPAHR